MSECRNRIEYGSPDEISKFSTRWSTDSFENQNRTKTGIMSMIDAVKVLEAQPKLPYKFPYSYESPNPGQCDSLPKLPTGVTLPMVKKQLNEVSQIIGLTIPFPVNTCPSEIQYGRVLLSTEWDTSTNEVKKLYTDLFNIEVDTIRLLEKKPTLPYKFPYQSDNKDWPSVNCDKLPTLPTGVTLPMVKKQLNERAEIMGLTIPFPDYNYTMIYIILLLLLVVVVAVIYTMSRPSKTVNKTKREGDYYY